jgi:microcystin-dependent protein
MQFIGEIRMFAGNFAPVEWALCQGQSLPIAGNDALFALIGTTYGGDGQTTFNLPNLSSRLPVHQSSGYPLGQAGGAEQVTLSTQQIPMHGHPMFAAHVTGSQVTPSGNLPANSFNVTPYINDSPAANMNAKAISSVGGSQAHDNMQPFLCINFIIALTGIFPSQA